ncbi:putative endo-beta-1,4-glucanase D [Colletotrichum spaethianum]|uniref:lytic cellulose monooxygenase (C4-dehydrogenating) n=1 Tax=Colletotrichum spaethianum TaxID=700344 RepID=A0AA37NTB2_9PEZI|nr:putative endo-beta-1,4-glucanase D [Colletotrichum spaethianum]GKT40672.1 putative endo-beta-1,4-glucanase D [Colletotrichum spaethianum]
MRFAFTAAALSTLVGYSAAHTLVLNLAQPGDAPKSDGRSTGTGATQYIRSPPSNSPVKDLKSADIVCNVNGGKAAKDFKPLAAGDSFTVEWYHNSPGDDIIDLSHKGPLITYIAPYTETDGTGAIWTKIAEKGYENGKWAVETLVANKGVSEPITLPASLKAGKYIIRQEIIALHESDTTYDVNPARGAQFYPECIQVEVTGTGSDVPPQNFDFNTGYTYADPVAVRKEEGSEAMRSLLVYQL